MNAELIAVGTELLLGDTINTDAAAVARLLSELVKCGWCASSGRKKPVLANIDGQLSH